MEEKMELLPNANLIRQNFINRFLLSRQQFKLEQKDFVERLTMPFDVWYDQAFMWDKLPYDVPVVTFSKALELLKSRKGDVLFMSECEDCPTTCHFTFNGEKMKGVVGRANACELAERISYEWREGARLFLENRYLEETLPEDLYLFDETYEWMIVFTHETDWNPNGTDDDTESRFCIAYGFDCLR